ncbi:MAG: TonB-dependent receptor [Bacteroidales bacterium]|nr:TonB-dependent receptor [Bacteroidales bacterium]
MKPIKNRSISVRMAMCLLAMLVSISTFAQNTLKGKVTDQTGQALPGVTVLIQGTTNGTVTGPDGSYSLSVKKGDTVEFTCIGMMTVTKTYDGTNRPVNISMEDDAMMLSETVVVGYGTQKKSSLTSAVSAIKGDDLLKAPSTNVSQVLAGRLPGISSVQESGEPGLDQASLRIRGSVYGVAYIVDGFPVSDINDIDPADIESVSILKDGASAAVYGLKAAGGVLIITTKRGDKGEAKITYNTSIGASMNANFPKFMNGPQYAYYYNVAQMMDQMANGEISSASEYNPYFTKANIEAMLNGDPTDGWDNVDYISEVFGTGMTQKHNVTAQGGTDKTKYFVSFGYLDQKGNIDNFNYKRYNVRANIDSQVAKNLKFTVGLSGVLGKRHTPAYLSGGSDGGSTEVGWFSIARQAIQMHPYLPKTYGGYYTGSVQNNQAYLVSPLAAIYESGYKDTRSTTFSVNTSLQYGFPWIKGLYAKVSGSFDYSNSYNKNLSTPYTMMQMYKTDTGDWAWKQRTDNPHVSDNVINLGEGSTYYQTLVGQASLNYSAAFGVNHVDGLALVEARDNKSNGLSAYAKDLPFASLPELSNGVATNSPIGGWSGASRSVGYVFRAKYDYDEKYLAEITTRLDGSYKFAGMEGNRWGLFPSASLGWRLSKEEFMKNIKAIDDLKLRASVGLLGNDSISEYMFLSTYSQAANVALGKKNGSTTINPAYYTTGIANTDLSWEKTLSYNVGYDLTMWGGKLGMEVDGFYNYTYDMLTYQSSGYPSSMGGYYPTWANYNSIDTKGIDILVSHRSHFELLGKPFWYDVAASMTYSKTRWLKYQDNPNIPDYRKVVGTTYGSILCWKADGLFTSEEEIDASPWYGTRPNVGDIKYVDINGDGKIDEDDKGYFGRSNRPQLTFGLNLNFSWNGFDFNAQFTGGALFDVSLTGTYYNGYDDNTIWTQTFKEGGNSPLFLVENAYSIYNTDATFPRITLGTASHGGDNGLSSTFWIRDGKYVRLKTAQLGYTIPKKVTDVIGIESLRVFAEGQNLFTIDGLPEGIDPESPGVNNGYYPQQKLIMGGFTITF